MLTCQRRTAIATGVRHWRQAKSSKPAALVTSPHGPMREQVTGLATVDDSNWHTQTALVRRGTDGVSACRECRPERRLFALSALSGVWMRDGKERGAYLRKCSKEGLR